MRSLILFAKNPEPGRVKTRLHGALSPVQAARLARAFLVDTARSMREVAVDDTRVAYAPAGAEHELRAIVGAGLDLEPQVDGDLGMRMRGAMEAAFSRGAHSVVLIGADSPTLPTATLKSAFDALDHRDVVVGPSADSGYFLIGVAARAASEDLLLALFADMKWGTDHVLPSTVERVAAAGVSLGWLPLWYDVDSPATLALLRTDIEGRRLAGEPYPEATADCLRELFD